MAASLCSRISLQGLQGQQRAELRTPYGTPSPLRTSHFRPDNRQTGTSPPHPPQGPEKPKLNGSSGWHRGLPRYQFWRLQEIVGMI